MKTTAQITENLHQWYLQAASIEEFKKISLKKYKFHGEWNYIIRPN
jgi:hypothetical protein